MPQKYDVNKASAVERKGAHKVLILMPLSYRNREAPTTIHLEETAPTSPCALPEPSEDRNKPEPNSRCSDSSEPAADCRGGCLPLYHRPASDWIYSAQTNSHRPARQGAR